MLLEIFTTYLKFLLKLSIFVEPILIAIFLGFLTLLIIQSSISISSSESISIGIRVEFIGALLFNSDLVVSFFLFLVSNQP
jgi:Na+-transporting NADH:ubiquinone oxidoreductase subunit NqrE